MDNTPINIKVLLGKVQISQEISFKVGDTIILDQKVEKPLILEIEGKKRIYGYPGVFNHKKAFKVVKYE